MPATVEICESNGAVETITHNITNSNKGDIDAVNLDPVAYPVIPGANTFEKFQRIHVTAMGGSSKIDNLKIWRTGALGANASHLTCARTAAYVQQTYAAPIKTVSTKATQVMPTSAPGTANLGIGGLLTGSLVAAGYSDYLVHQIQTTALATAGTTTTMSYQYDEIA